MNESRKAESGRTFAQLMRDFALITCFLFLIWVSFRIINGTSVTEETLQEVSNYAVEISTQLLNGQEQKAASNRTKHGYTVLVHILENKFFEIVLDLVPKSICEGLQVQHGAQVSSLYVNGQLMQKEALSCRKYNQIVFEFRSDLGTNVSNEEKPRTNHCQSQSDCDSCSVCRNGSCQSGCLPGEVCGMNLNGQGICCPASQFKDPICCPYVDVGKCCWGRNKCCPDNKPIRLKDGSCTDCYDTRVFQVGSSSSVNLCLKLCPHREAFGEEGLCMLPVCAANQFTDRGGNCVDCKAHGSFETSLKECQKCPNRTYKDDRCVLSCPGQTVMNQQGVCESCDSLNAILTSEKQDCISACPNRELSESGCVLKTCPTGFVRNQKGNCVSCQEQSALEDVSPELCAQCPNRQMIQNQCVLSCPDKSFRAENGQCIDCLDARAVPVFPGECQKCPNRLAFQQYCFADCEEGQFRDGWGTCRGCGDLGSYPVGQVAACAVCSNRSVFLYQRGDKNQPYCRLQMCPIDYFADGVGGCHDCFENQPIRGTEQAECEKCPNRFWSVMDQTCFLKPNCLPGQLLDSYGQCQSCGDSTEVFAIIGRESVCDVCPNRYVFGGWCRVCPRDLRTLSTKEGCLKCGGQWDNRIAECAAVKRSS